MQPPRRTLGRKLASVNRTEASRATCTHRFSSLTHSLAPTPENTAFPPSRVPILTRAYAGAYAYPAPRSPPAASRTTPWVWAADPQDPLALGDLRGYAVPQLAVGLDLAAAEAEALDLDQAAPDGPLRGVEVEEGQVGPLEAHLAAQRVAVSLRAGAQFEVGVQGTTGWSRKASWCPR